VDSPATVRLALAAWTLGYGEHEKRKAERAAQLSG
jgi:hypothetical protein